MRSCILSSWRVLRSVWWSTTSTRNTYELIALRPDAVLKAIYMNMEVINTEGAGM